MLSGYLILGVTLFASAAYGMMIEGKQMSIDDAIIKAGANSTKMFELMQSEDTVMIELDIEMKLDDYNAMMEDIKAENETDISSRKKRKARRDLRYRWVNAVVPYDMDTNTFSSRDRQIINDAISDYHNYTCIRFRPATGADSNRIRFQNGGGCSSYVGMIGGTQPVTLASGCRYKGIVIHEMGHAIGFNHEQTRPDRDRFVSIQNQNIQSGLEHNFQKYSTQHTNTYNVPYDYRSVMHYSQTAFTANGQPTIIAVDSQFQSQMGNREGFSFNDIKLANLMYSCSDSCQTTCPSNGFVGQDCKCYCDSGRSDSPIKECGSTGGGVTTASPSTTTPSPTNCQNRHLNCDYWANQGYCTGTYETYMSTNCPLACRRCSEMTTTTTTPAPTRAPNSCMDQSRFCEYWARRGECRRNPSYMMRNCKKACDACDDNPASTCEDMNENCPYWTRYCESYIYRNYLSMNCRKSCNICSVNSEISTVQPTAETPDNDKMCQNKESEVYCTSKSHKCVSSSRVMLKCAKTCGLC